MILQIQIWPLPRRSSWSTHGGRNGLVDDSIFKINTCLLSLQKYSRRTSKIILSNAIMLE